MRRGTKTGWSFKLILACLTVYAMACIGCASFQRRLIYFPPRISTDQFEKYARSAGFERWINRSHEAIGVKRLFPQSADGQILIAYGNANWTIGSAYYADEIQSVAAFDVFILEYPGYADRKGSPSQKNIFRAADEAFQLLETNKPIYILGESLGSGVASYLAGTYSNKIAGIILISPFNNFATVAQSHYPFLPVRLLLADRFPSDDYLCNYHGKVAITLDGKDVVVPAKFGKRLYDGYAGPKKLWEFPDGNHCQIMEPQFWREAVEFLKAD